MLQVLVKWKVLPDGDSEVEHFFCKIPIMVEKMDSYEGDQSGLHHTPSWILFSLLRQIYVLETAYFHALQGTSSMEEGRGVMLQNMSELVSFEM